MGADLKPTPSAAMLEAGEQAIEETFRQYGCELRDGGRIQLLVNIWRAMEAARGVPGLDPQSSSHDTPLPRNG